MRTGNNDSRFNRGSPKAFAKKVIESLQGTVSIYVLHSFKIPFTFLNVFLNKKTTKAEGLQAQQKFSSERNRGPKCLQNEQCTKPDRSGTSVC